jgi:hypothetical protein
MLPAFHLSARTPLAPVGDVSTEWIIAALMLLLWAGIFILFGRRQRKYNRRQNREIAERLVSHLPPHPYYQRDPAPASEVPGLNQLEFEKLTAEFEKIGFVRQLDYRLIPVGQQEMKGFARVLSHPEHLCFGEVMCTRQMLNESAVPGFGINSVLQDGWEIGSTNLKPRPMLYLWRLPRGLSLRLPGLSPGELLRRHLELRTRVTTDLEVSVRADVSLEDFFSWSTETIRKKREILFTRNIVKELREANRIVERGYWEWLGDYPMEKARHIKANKH